MKLKPAKCVFGVSLGKFLNFMVSQERIEANPKKERLYWTWLHQRIVKEVQRLTGQIMALNKFVFKATDKHLPVFKIYKQNGQVRSNLSKPQGALTKAFLLMPINTRRRSILVFGYIPNGNQFSLDSRRKQDPTASLLHKSSFSRG